MWGLVSSPALAALASMVAPLAGMMLSGSGSLPQPATSATPPGPVRVPWGRILRCPSVWALCGLYGCGGFSGNFFVTFLPIYLRDHRHFTPEMTKWFSSLPLACGIGGCVLGGVLIVRTAEQARSHPGGRMIHPRQLALRCFLMRAGNFAAKRARYCPQAVGYAPRRRMADARAGDVVLDGERLGRTGGGDLRPCREHGEPLPMESNRHDSRRLSLTDT